MLTLAIAKLTKNNDIYTGLFIMNRDLGNLLKIVPKLTAKFMKFMNFKNQFKNVLP